MARVPLPAAEPMKLTTLAEVASGGMGSVEMARVDGGRLAGQILAIKRLHSSIANDQAFVDMFLDEAWLTAAMKSPHVMGVVAHGTDERGIFLAVELIEGVPLSRLLKEARARKEAFSEQVVACIGMQICDGLTEAHGLKGTDGKPLGLVHRDLTPGNVLISFNGKVKIVDFGIAKAEERITHTRTGTMKGKPAYMAPEQAKGSKNIDLRADLFSLGVMLFELLAGRRPWLEKSAFDMLMAAALKPHPNIAELRPGVSPLFVEIIEKCLAKKAAERWSSAAEIRDKLLSWRNDQIFPGDDVVALRDFVVRCSQAQIEWFRRARAGDFVKGDAQTFKELEEAIDEARKKSGEAPLSIAPPASSGRAAFEAMTPSRAKVTAEGAPITPKPPSSSAEPATQPLPPTYEAVEHPPRGGLGATIALSESDLEIGDSPPKGVALEPQSGTRKGLGGTAYLEASPLKGMAIADPSTASDLAATIRLADVPMQHVQSRSVSRPTGSKLATGEAAVLEATPRDEEAPPAARAKPDARKQPEPAATEPKGLSGATVIVLILVAFIAGGAIAAWVAKTYLIKSGGLDGGGPAATARLVSSP